MTARYLDQYAVGVVEEQAAAVRLGITWPLSQPLTVAERSRRYRARQRGDMAPFVPLQGDLLTGAVRVGECLEWRRADDGRHGYGKVWHNGAMVGAHRAALEAKLGRPLLPGMKACHTCDNRQCIEREHLFEAPQLDNVRDMIAKGRAWWQLVKKEAAAA